MEQLHKRSSDEPIKILFQGYCQGLLTRMEIQDLLSISKSRVFALLHEYREDTATFLLA